MNRTLHTWTKLTIILTMLLSIMIPMTAYGASASINITNLNTNTNSAVVPAKPVNDNLVERFTTSSITLLATIQNISDSQVQDIFYEIENFNTGVKSSITTNKATHANGSFDIVFSNVILTEGLNKVTIKLGTSNVIASAPGWAYFTAATNISNLLINNAVWDANKIYPDIPSLGSALTIKGDAINSTSVQAFVSGSSAPKNAFLNANNFFFTADDASKNNTTATFGLNAGDNLISLVSKNSTKTFQTQRNLIYDNGKPFAFNAKIQAEDTNKLPVGPLKDLISIPTVTSQNAQISAQLKSDLNGNNVKYRYVDVMVNGQVSGTYDLQSASTAARAFSVYPNQFTAGYDDTYISINGTGLDSSGISVNLEDKTSASVTLLPALDSLGSPIISQDKQTILYKVLASDLTMANSPYKLIVKDGQDILNSFPITVVNPSTTIGFTTIAFPPITLSEGYDPLTPLNSGLGNTLTFNNPVTSNAVSVDILNLNGQGLPLATYTGTGSNNAVVNFDITPGLIEGKYKIRVSYAGNPMAEREMDIGARIPAAPIVVSPPSPAIFSNYNGVSGATSTPTYFTVSGTNMATKAADISNILIAQDLTAGPQVTYNASSHSLSISDPNASSIKYLVGGSIQSALTVKTTGTAYTAPLLASEPILNNEDLSVVSLDTAGEIIGYNDYVVTVTGVAPASLITAAAIQTISTSAIDPTNISPYIAQGNNVIFKLKDPSDPFFTDGVTYQVYFDQQLRFPDGSPATTVTVGPIKKAARSNFLTDNLTTTYIDQPYVTDISPLQIQSGPTQATTNITITGANFLNQTNLVVKILNEDGTPVGGGVVAARNLGASNATTAIATVPAGLGPGKYMLNVVYNGNTLAQYPFVLTNPRLITISPATASSANSSITLQGSGLGRIESLLKMSFAFDSDPTVVIPTQAVVLGTLEKGTTAQFKVPANLQQGTYTVTLLYNNVPAGTAAYTVNSSPTVLKENSALSKANRYRVFDFKADLNLTVNKVQSLQFQFYNVVTDKAALVPRLFIFNYVDPTLPYVDYISKGIRVGDFPLSLTSTNEINELPETFNVYADKNTNKINIYLGDFDNNTPVYKSMVYPIPVVPGGVDYTVTPTSSSLLSGAGTPVPPVVTAGVFDLTIGGSNWNYGDKIVIDNVTFTATNGVTSGNSFDLGDRALTTIAANLITAIGFNAGLTAKYAVSPGAATDILRFAQKPTYETPIPLSVSDTSAGGVTTVATYAPYVGTTPGSYTSTLSGSVAGADAITVTIKNGGLSTPIITDAISVKGKTVEQVASTIASKLTQLGVNGYTVTNASGTRDVVFTQNYAFNVSSGSTGGPLTLTINGGYNIFSFTINTIANGQTKITAVPSSSNGAALPVKSGENLSGDRTYNLNILSSPYVILDNIYTGMTIKDDPGTTTVENQSNLITCATGNTTLDSCISGRLINVPSNEYANVEVTLNGVKSNLRNPLSPPPPSPTSDFESIGSSRFHFQFGPNAVPVERTGVLTEGKNTLKFAIYGHGQLLTESVFEIFLFSNTAPTFASLKPDESVFNANTIKYLPTKVDDTYATTETVVSLVGQFVNADDIKLTVKSTDDSGAVVSSYDRRFGGNFLTPDPAVNNPNYLVVDATANGNFKTNPIKLSKKGNTTFEFTITNSTKITVVRTITITREPLPYRIISPQLTLNANKESQANINGNYVMVEMEAEGADKVTFGKDDATARQVIDANNNSATHYFYEAANLKVGANKLNFTITTGKTTTKGTIVLFNTNTNIEGAQFKSVLKPKLSAFNSDVLLTFPANTNLIRNDTSQVNQYITANRSILFGIANANDGRVDKVKHPSATDAQIGNPNPLIPAEAPLLLTEPTHRFRPASKLYWIDAGTIASNETDIKSALNGSGREPYDDTNFYSRDIKDLVVPTKRGTLTLKYDPNIRSEAWKYLTVYHYDIYEDYTGSTQYRWRNVGGVVDSTKNTITVPFDTFGYYQVMFMNQSFDDVTGHAWARNQLDTLYSKGIMVNKDSSNFVPNDPITRGEFTALLVKIFDIPMQFTETPTFTDVQRVNPSTNGLYDYMSIETAARAGIVRGGGGGRFDPDSTITRQDAASMIARAANLKLNSSADLSLVALQKSFTDAGTIDVYARTAVEAVTKAALITGKENVLIQGQKKTTFRFDPKDTLTRAEASQVSIQVLRQQKKIPK